MPRRDGRQPRSDCHIAGRAHWALSRLAALDAGDSLGGGQAMRVEAAVRAWGIGVGPGDPELLALKALRLIRAADVIAYPPPEDGESVARAIVDPHRPGGQSEIAI